MGDKDFFSTLTPSTAQAMTSPFTNVREETVGEFSEGCFRVMAFTLYSGSYFCEGNQEIYPEVSTRILSKTAINETHPKRETTQNSQIPNNG